MKNILPGPPLTVILIRSLLAFLLLLTLLGILTLTPFGQGFFDEDSARQACLDHMAE